MAESTERLATVVVSLRRVVVVVVVVHRNTVVEGRHEGHSRE